MAKEVTRFQSDSGALFETEAAAHTDDLRNMFRKAIESDVHAQAVAKFIAENIDDVMPVIAALRRAQGTRELPLAVRDAVSSATAQ